MTAATAPPPDEIHLRVTLPCNIYFYLRPVLPFFLGTDDKWENMDVCLSRSIPVFSFRLLLERR